MDSTSMSYISMSTQDDDDIDINPFTMLLLTDRPEEQKLDDDSKLTSPIEDHSPNQQQHYLTSMDSTMSIHQLRSQGLSFELWPAATSLFSLFDHHCSHPSSTSLTPSLSSPRSCRLCILELGSGTGLVNRLCILELPWGDVDQMEALIGREYDLVLGSDVVYRYHLYDPHSVLCVSSC